LSPIIQEKRVKDPLGYTTKYRANPYNPLTYVALPIIFIVGILFYGINGFIERFNKNPFKWK